MTAVYKMSKGDLLTELQVYGLEAHGNIHDLRETVQLGREIVKMFPEKRIARVFDVTHLAPNDYVTDLCITGDIKEYSDRIKTFIAENKLLSGDVIFVGSKDPDKQDCGFAVVRDDGTFSTKEIFHLDTCDYEQSMLDMNTIFQKYFGKNAC